MASSKVKLAFAGTTSVKIDRPNDVVCIGSLQYISGTGTLVVEGSFDGVNFAALALQKSDGTFAASVTAAGIYHFDPGACTDIQVRCSAFTSAIAGYAAIVPHS